MDGETIYGIIHVFFLIAGGYFLTEAEKIFEEKHYYSTWWMILYGFCIFLNRFLKVGKVARVNERGSNSIVG